MDPTDGRKDRGVAEDPEARGCGFMTELTIFSPVVARLDWRTWLTWFDWFETENILVSWRHDDCASEHWRGKPVIPCLVPAACLLMDKFFYKIPKLIRKNYKNQSKK